MTTERRIHGRTWLVVLLSVVIFVSGAIVGGGATMMWIRNQSREAWEHPERMSERIAGRIAERFELDDEQTARVREVVRRRHQALMQARESMLSQVDPELDRFTDEIAAQIPADRRDDFRSSFEDMRRSWFSHKGRMAGREKRRGRRELPPGDQLLDTGSDDG